MLMFDKDCENYYIDWKLDGQSFLSLIDTEIDKLSDLSPEEKDKLKNYLKEQKSLSKDETTINQETQEKKTDSETKEKEPVDNKKEEKKDNEVKEKIVEVKIEEKKKEENEIKINVESKKEDIIKFLEKHKLKLETLTEEELEKSKDIKKEEKEIIKNFLGTKLRGKNKNIDNNEDGGRPNLQRANKIQDILQLQESSFETPEWEIPKGKLLNNEEMIDGAIREFSEETSLTREDITVYKNIEPIVEIFKGTDDKSYMYVYYIALLNNNVDLIYNDFDGSGWIKKLWWCVSTR